MRFWAPLREGFTRRGWTECFGCRHFVNDPATLEAEIPGLTALSSGYASVRADDGLCRLHATYSNGRRACAAREGL